MGLSEQGQANLKIAANTKTSKMYVNKFLTAQNEYFYQVSCKNFQWFYVRLPKENLPAPHTEKYKEIKKKFTQALGTKFIPFTDMDKDNVFSFEFVFGNETKFSGVMGSEEGSAHITTVYLADLQLPLNRRDIQLVFEVMRDIAPHQLFHCDRDKI